MSDRKILFNWCFGNLDCFVLAVNGRLGVISVLANFVFNVSGTIRSQNGRLAR